MLHVCWACSTTADDDKRTWCADELSTYNDACTSNMTLTLLPRGLEERGGGDR